MMIYITNGANNGIILFKRWPFGGHLERQTVAKVGATLGVVLVICKLICSLNILSGEK